jgi:hypothetical protein
VLSRDVRFSEREGDEEIVCCDLEGEERERLCLTWGWMLLIPVATELEVEEGDDKEAGDVMGRGQDGEGEGAEATRGSEQGIGTVGMIEKSLPLEYLGTGESGSGVFGEIWFGEYCGNGKRVGEEV